MDAGHGMNQIAMRRAGAGWRRCWRRRERGQFGKDARGYFRLQLWKLAIEGLRHRPLDNLLELLVFRHAHRTISIPESFSQSIAHERTLFQALIIRYLHGRIRVLRYLFLCVTCAPLNFSAKFSGCLHQSHWAKSRVTK